MFTGIIQSTAKLNQIVNKNNNYTFVLESNLRLIKKDIGNKTVISIVLLGNFAWLPAKELVDAPANNNVIAANAPTIFFVSFILFPFCLVQIN